MGQRTSANIRTFRTIAQTVYVPELDVHLLMNHSIPGVNAGYITRNKLLRDHLRTQQEAISQKIITAALASRKDGNRSLAAWIEAPSRKFIANLLEPRASQSSMPWRARMPFRVGSGLASV